MYTFSTTLQTALAAGNPQRVLIEFTHKPDGTAYNPVKQFSNEDILITDGVEWNVNFNGESDLTIGICPSAEIHFTLLNDNDQLANFEFGTFKAYLGARIDTGTPAQDAKTKTFTEGGVVKLYEFAPLGTFIAEKPDVVKKYTVQVDANDQMTLFDVDMPTATALGITYPTTLATLVQKMCTYLNVAYASLTFLNYNLVIAKEPSSFKDATMKEVLGWVAEAACSNAHFTRVGELEFQWLNTVNVTYDESNYSDFVPSWYETGTINKLHIRNEDSTAELVVGNGNNGYMIQNNPFLRQKDQFDTFEILANPVSARAKNNENVFFNVIANGYGLTYQWMERASSSGTWANSTRTGNQTAELSFTALTNMNGRQFRCVVTDADNSTLTTETATLYILT